MSRPLPIDLHSPEQMGVVLLELRNLASAQRQKAVAAKVTGKPAADAPQPSWLLGQVLKEAGVKVDDPAALEALYNELEITRARAPTVRMTLTALPTRAYKRQFTTWFRTNVHSDTLVSFAVRSDIGGGATLIAGSHIYDFSFRERLMSNKAHINEIFARVRQ